MSALDRHGIWVGWSEATPDLARTVERCGFATLWLGKTPGGDLTVVEQALAATSTLRVATGVVNIYKDDAASMAEAWHRIEAAHRGRFLLGLGVSHPERMGERWVRPYQAMVDYLDALDAAGVPVGRRVLAALGPRMLDLAAGRSLGAHPYLTTPEHTRSARDRIGAGPLLVPEQKVVLDTDAARARAIGRPVVAEPYLRLSNYRRSLTTLGFTEADLDDDGSDAVIDALVVHGDDTTIRARLAEHLAAGADEVAVQVLTGPGEDLAPAVEHLADALGRPAPADAGTHRSATT